MNAPARITDRACWAGKHLLLLGVVFCTSGATCSRSFRNPFTPLGPPAPEVLLDGASLDQVIAAVNQNSARVISYQTNDASITVPGIPGIPLLRGNIAAQRPGRLRIQASTALTGPEVDLGSNDELFWFWTKRNEPPALYFARHDQFVGSAAQQVMPIEPQWLLDAIGLSQFSPNDQHQGPVPRGDGTLEIQTIMQTRTGTMTKSTVVDARRAWVLEQHIYDSAGTLLASSRARSHRYHPAMGVSLPQEIDISLPAAQMSLSINVGTVLLNQVADNPALWSLPALSGVQQIDLGTAPPGAVPKIGAGSLPVQSVYSQPNFEAAGFVAPRSVEPIPESTAPPAFAQTYPATLLPETPESFIGTASAVLPLDPSLSQPYPQQLPPGGIPASVGGQR